MSRATRCSATRLGSGSPAGARPGHGDHPLGAAPAERRRPAEDGVPERRAGFAVRDREPARRSPALRAGRPRRRAPRRPPRRPGRRRTPAPASSAAPPRVTNAPCPARPASSTRSSTTSTARRTMSTVCCRLTARTSSRGATAKTPAGTSGPACSCSSQALNADSPAWTTQPDTRPADPQGVRRRRAARLPSARALRGPARPMPYAPCAGSAPRRAAGQPRGEVWRARSTGQARQAPTEPCLLVPGPLGSQ